MKITTLRADQLNQGHVGKTVRFKVFCGTAKGVLEKAEERVNQFSQGAAIAVQISQKQRFGRWLKTHWLPLDHPVEVIENADGQE